jgi:hypothetical protein
VKTALFLVLTASAFADTQAVQEGGPFTQEDYRLYVETVGFKGGYNMGPLSKHGVMKGMPMPAHGSGGFKWGPCNRSMLSPTFVDGWIRTPGGKYRNPAYMVKPGGVACAKL